jgi:putative methylase
VIKKRDLEIALSRVPPFEEPDPALEQYATPAGVAADVLFEAYSRGDIGGMRVLDLGCGTGVLSVGAWLLGAAEVSGIDADEKALAVAERHAAGIGAAVSYKKSLVSEVSAHADTVVMNPPFGCQSRGADRPFLDKAMESAGSVYSIHKAETLGFLREYAEERGRRVEWDRTYKYRIPHLFAFHREKSKPIDIVAVNIR